ncbi:MAG: methyltransferase [Muribaculaceae bacterium]|nr:methyltransferase [Muribaculaceae bacterium]
MFSFKQFNVEDSASGLKVGTDAVLIGVWTNVNGLDDSSLVVDAGAGCGIISLIIAQRCQAKIEGVEIDHDACLDCEKNFTSSPWPERLNTCHSDFLDYYPTPSTGINLIISNPPFFSTGIRAGQQARANARHEDRLPMNELIGHAARLLVTGGRLSMVIPTERENEIIWHSSLVGLTPSRLCRVRTTPKQPPKRLLIELTKGKAKYKEEILCIHDLSGTYSDEFTALVKDFYLKM